MNKHQENTIPAVPGDPWAVVDTVRGQLQSDTALLSDEARRRARELDVLTHVGLVLAREMNLTTIFRVVVETTVQMLGYAQVGLHMLAGNTLVLQHHVGYTCIREHIPLTSGIVGRVARIGQPILLHNPSTDPEFIGSPSTSSEVCVPLFDAGRVVGVLNVETTNEPLLDDNDLRLMTLLSTHVSLAIERARLHTEVCERERRFQSLIEHTNDVILVLDEHGIIRYASHSAERMLGYTPEYILGHSIYPCLHREDVPTAQTVFQLAIQHPGRMHRAGEYRVRRNTGEWCIFEVVATSLLHDPTVQGIVVNGHDITERKAVEGRLQRMALYDTLTGLPNRAFLMEHLQRIIDKTQHHPQHRFALLFLDFDNFKLVNDSLGHLVGDQFLQEITTRLRQCVCSHDIIARLGGDEFTIVLENISDTLDALEVAGRIQRILAEPFYLNAHEMCTSASIGIALSSLGYTRAEDMLRDADTAMYQAKDLGKARHVVFDANMHTAVMQRLLLQTELQRSIDRHELRVFYQPIVELATGHVTGFEALVRWQHPQRGLLTPAAFFHVAEETGAIVPIGEWVLREACHQLRAWQTLFPQSASLTMSVNLSGKQFKQPDLIKTIDHMLRDTGVAPSQLILEMAEGVVMERDRFTSMTLANLQARGIPLCIDDFGTGYASLNCLQDFPLQSLKIDGSFVERMGAGDKAAEIVRAIVELAQNLHLEIVAEGIETQSQADQLRELGCTYGQGYFFSPPIDSVAATRLISGESPIPCPAAA